MNINDVDNFFGGAAEANREVPRLLATSSGRPRSRSIVHQWRRRGYVPSWAQFELEVKTNGGLQSAWSKETAKTFRFRD